MKKYPVLVIFGFAFLLSCNACEEKSISQEQQRQIYLEAWAKFDEGNIKAALEMLETNIREIDRGGYYYFLRGFFARSLNSPRYDYLALEYFMKAYRINPNRFDVNHMIGSTLNLLGEHEQAIPFLERAFELYLPNSGEIPPYGNLARAYLRVGRLEEALVMNTKAIEYDGNPWNYFRRGVILSHILPYNEDIQALFKYYNRAVEIDIEMDNTESRYLWVDLAIRLIEMGHVERAYQIYRAWLEVIEDEDIEGFEDLFWSIYLGMGYIMMLNGEWEESLVLLRKADAIFEKSNLAVLYLSFYYFFTGDYEKAFQYEALARAQQALSGQAIPKRTNEEFLEGYKRNWRFQKLLEIHKLEKSRQ